MSSPDQTTPRLENIFLELERASTTPHTGFVPMLTWMEGFNIDELDMEQRQKLVQVAKTVVERMPHGSVSGDTMLRAARLFPDILPELAEKGGNLHATYMHHGRTQGVMSLLLDQATGMVDAMGAQFTYTLFERLLDKGLLPHPAMQGPDPYRPMAELACAIAENPWLHGLLCRAIPGATIEEATDVLASLVCMRDLSLEAAQLAIAQGADLHRPCVRRGEKTTTLFQELAEHANPVTAQHFVGLLADRAAGKLDDTTPMVSLPKTRRF